MNNPKFFIIFPLLLLYTIYYLFDALKSWELFQGFIINPWGKKLILPLEVIELLFTHKPTSFYTVVKRSVVPIHVDAIVNK